MRKTSPITIDQFILEQEYNVPHARGQLSQLLYDIAFVAKIITREVRKAGLVDILGSTGEENIQGEDVQKLDEYANDTMIRTMSHKGRLCVMGSEEREHLIEIPLKYPTGDYVLLFDPLDGSSNIDSNVSIGTIFSIHRKVSTSERGDLSDLLQPGKNQVAAGYVVYGSSTMMVYSTGAGVHGFTLDPSIGEFLLSHPSIQIPKEPKYYSVNEAYYKHWPKRVQNLVDDFKGLRDENATPRSARYIGSLVADFHRNLIGGGVFLYPADSRNPTKPQGKLRLLYEASPLAFIAEQAGGAASDGSQRILDIIPTELHQRTPLFIGNKEDVLLCEKFLSGQYS